MPAVKIDLKDAGNFMEKVVSKAIREGAKKGLYSAALRMVSIIQTRIIPQTTPKPIDRGIYRAGWVAGQDNDGSAYYENTVPHAAMIEHGVRASNVRIGTAMIDSLTEWVQRKGIASGPTARKVAWAIALNVARGKGIFGPDGLQIMGKANKQLAKVVEQEVAREVDRALKSM
jgi:hypothetical protein|tara:strand:- start:755 stop:1273 length:519 start_codon:yes stop_codon:yes gene_type:complete